MKITSTILVLTLATATSFAQSATPASKTPAAPAAKSAPVPAKPVASTPAPAQKPADKALAQQKAVAANPTAQKAAPVPAKAAADAKASAPAKTKKAKKSAAVPAQKTESNASAPNAAQAKVASAMRASNKRDPFVSPIVNKIGGPTGCATGKKCLMPDQVRLQGIVRSVKGMIAMVVNPANKTYFLYENDPVFNGYVVKITADSIVFKETVQDRLGKPMTREVVKKVNTPAV